MYGGGEFRFDFSRLEHLKNIKMEISRVSNYKFNVPGKKDGRWIDLETPYTDEQGNNKKGYLGELVIDLT